jgi:hypothetical protein
MSNTHEEPSTGSDSEIRIERVVTDKTRKDVGSDTMYHVYFELSGDPPTEWRTIFAREWKGLHPAVAASVDGAFLVVHCQLQEVLVTQLPALKKAVATTNEEFKRYVQKEAAALKQREDVWTQERKDVDAMASSLRFK